MSKTQTLLPVNRDEIRSLKGDATADSNLYKINFDIIVPDWEFNKREDYVGIPELAQNILDNGQIQPIIGDFLKTQKGKVIFSLTDGFRRYLAFKWLKENKKQVPQVKALLNEKGISREQRYFKMFATQDSLPLSDIEKSNLIMELVNMNLDHKDIAKGIGKSLTYVNDMIELHKQSSVVKKAIRDGQTSATAVAIIAKKKGADQTTKIVSDSIKNNEKFTVKRAQEVISESPQQKFKYEIKLIMPETLAEMKDLKQQLIALPERNSKQLKFLVQLEDAIKIRKDAAESLPKKESVRIDGETKFGTILQTKFTVTFCDQLPIDMCQKIFDFFKIEIEG